MRVKFSVMTAPTQKRRGFLFSVFSGAVLAALFFHCSGVAAPRPLAPPWPSFGTLHHEGFDQPYGFAPNQVIDPAIWAESWSGYALQRSGTSVVPWAVPMVVSNSFRIEPERGAIRFWYRPDYASGTGSGTVATLLELATSNGKASEVWWSLVVSPDGSELHLICQTENEPQSCLQAAVNWEAGSWHMLTLGFTPTNSVLFVDDQLAAVGEGLATIPQEAAPYTSLTVGSTANGTAPAQGQIEELCVFTGRKRTQQLLGNIFGLSVDWDIGLYHAALSKTAALGPISAEEIAARAVRAAQRKAEREALGIEAELGGGMQMLLLSGPTATCVTNSPLYITNTVAWFDASTGWTVQFDVQGTNALGTTGGPVEIFAATNLAGSHLTNAPWLFLERGPSCRRYEYTNQSAAMTFYLLGDGTIDPDGDGLSTAYELLIAHSNPLVFDLLDSDGDGLSDAWELAHESNPQEANAGDDPDADGIPNLQEYLGGTRPGVAEGFSVWVGQPGVALNLP